MIRGHWFLGLALVAAAACNNNDTTDTNNDTTPGDTDTDTTGGGDQIPPQGYATLNPWLQAGNYTTWNCEATAHPGGGVSPHGMNRICSNDLVSANISGEYPVGSASVKELYDEAGTTIVGYAVTSKVSSGGGESWYWYEQVPPETTTPPVDVNGVVADGLGDSGPAMTICVSCHVTAPNDYVWTQVQ